VTNVTDQTPFTGIIEMTTMVDPEHFGGHSLVYLPKYVKRTDPVFKMSDDEIKNLFWNTLKNMYDHISEEDLVSFKVARAPHVFALSTIGYSENLPEISTSLPGVHILNSAHIVNGTLNVNETLQLVEKKLPAIIESARKRPQNIQSYE
jgi:protoporphyrinogen oxidase